MFIADMMASSLLIECISANGQEENLKTKQLLYSALVGLMRELVHLLRRSFKEIVLKFRQDVEFSVFLIKKLP